MAELVLKHSPRSMKNSLQKFITWLQELFASTVNPINPMPLPNPLPVEPSPAVIPPTTKIDLWCKAATKMEGANPKYCNPGNIRWIAGTWEAKLAIDQHNGFCVFKDAQTGYNVLKELFTRAATGQSSVYHPTMTLYDFYAKYAPDSDGNNSKHYAEFVASFIGVLPTVQIKTLV